MLRYPILFVFLVCLAVAGCASEEVGGGSGGAGGQTPNGVAVAGLLVVPGAVLLQGSGDERLLSVRGFGIDGQEVPLDGFALEWTIAGDPALSLESTDAPKAIVRTDDDVASGFVGVRLRDDPAIAAPAVSVVAAVVKAEVVLVDDEDVVFPPPAIAFGADLSVSKPDGITVEGDGDGGDFSGFSESELANRVHTDPDGALLYPVVLRGPAPASGTILFARGGARVAGQVVDATERDGFSLLQLRLVGPIEVFEELQYDFSAEGLAREGIPVEELYEVRVGAEQAVEKFRLGRFECTVLGGVSPPTTGDFFTASAGPIADVNLTITEGTVREFFLKLGFGAELSANPEIRLEAGLALQLRCEPLDSLLNAPLRLGGPLALVFEPEFEVVAPKFVVGGSVSATALRIGYEIGFDYAVWGGVRYTEAGGWEWLCSNAEDCFDRKHDGDFVLETLDLESVPVRYEFNALVAIAGNVNLQLGGALVNTVASWAGSIPILGNSFLEIEDDLELNFLFVNLGPRWVSVFENAERVVFNEETEAAAQVVLTAEVGLGGTAQALTTLARQALLLATPGTFNPIFPIARVNLTDPYEYLQREQVFVDGVSWSEGVDPPLSVAPDDVLDLRVDMTSELRLLEEVIGTLSGIAGLENKLFDEKPHLAEVWTKTGKVAELDLTGEFRAEGSVPITDELCSAAGSPPRLHFVAYNSGIGGPSVPNYVGNVELDCEEEGSKLFEVIPRQWVLAGAWVQYGTNLTHEDLEHYSCSYPPIGFRRESKEHRAGQPPIEMVSFGDECDPIGSLNYSAAANDVYAVGAATGGASVSVLVQPARVSTSTNASATAAIACEPDAPCPNFITGTGTASSELPLRVERDVEVDIIFDACGDSGQTSLRATVELRTAGNASLGLVGWGGNPDDPCSGFETRTLAAGGTLFIETRARADASRNSIGEGENANASASVSVNLRPLNP